MSQEEQIEIEEAIEQEIQEKGLTAPRVTPEHIQSLFDRLEFVTTQISDTNVHCGAYLGTFRIASGFAGCASPENFNLSIGEKASRENAEYAARDKLWELEGYRLFCELNDIASVSAAPVQAEAETAPTEETEG